MQLLDRNVPPSQMRRFLCQGMTKNEQAHSYVSPVDTETSQAEMFSLDEVLAVRYGRCRGFPWPFHNMKEECCSYSPYLLTICRDVFCTRCISNFAAPVFIALLFLLS